MKIRLLVDYELLNEILHQPGAVRVLVAGNRSTQAYDVRHYIARSPKIIHPHTCVATELYPRLSVTFTRNSYIVPTSRAYVGSLNTLGFCVKAHAKLKWMRRTRNG